MPSQLPNSFASAAAGGNGQENGLSRRDGSGGEWSRSRPNGATQTFRRTSQATVAQSRDSSQSAVPNSSGPYVPPRTNQTQGGQLNGVAGDTRYSKEQLLQIYERQARSSRLDRNLSGIFTGPWDPYLDTENEARGESKDQMIGPEVCWNTHTGSLPLNLVDMSDNERQLFATSVNPPVKPNQGKDGGNINQNTRKASVSNHHGGYNTTPANSLSRPGTRRRETSESFGGNGPLSPTESKTFFRETPATSTPPTSLQRRRTGYKDDELKSDVREPDGADEEEFTPRESLRRLNTGPLLGSATNGPTSSPWSSTGPRSAFDSFGAFAVGNPSAQETEKRPGFGSARGGSRFKDILAKASTEDMSPVVREKTSTGALMKLTEDDAHQQLSAPGDGVKNRPSRSDTNPYDDGIPRTGSAALSQHSQGVEQMGFSSFGNHEPGALHSTPSFRRQHDALSPTTTNPYQSPANRNDEGDGNEPGAGNVQPFGSGRRDMFSGGYDRNSGGFGGPRPAFGTATNWSSGFGGTTPNRERSALSTAFGDTIFSPMSDLQSPSSANLGGGFFGGSGFGSAGRPSRLNAMFPPAMQDQMRPDSRNGAFEARADNVSARDPFESGGRRPDNFRALFEEARTTDAAFNAQPGSVASAPISGPAQRTSVGPEQSIGHGPSPSSGSSTSNTLPAAQQRQMVMPDRMRWIYRDPSGDVQGPWSGLEMHDWFKAGFFTAELQVKKLEDAEFEPLAQLVRRIGNSREPFLVPQIGIPHGPPSANTGNNWATTIGGTGAQPPFASSFPSFGTTLTAEQQNALERRKQEEQYLMARQKEHLAQQQMFMKQMGGAVPNLQHHSSAQSLHSQPSFGSITSPGGYQQQQSHNPPAPIQPPQQPLTYGHGQPPRADELPGMVQQMSFSQRGAAAFGQQPIGQSAVGPAHQSLSERSREQQALEEAFLGEGGRNERLEEFQDLRKQIDDEDIDEDEDGVDDEGSLPQPIGAQRPLTDFMGETTKMASHPTLHVKLHDNLSLTEQVQRTNAAMEKAAQDKYIEPPPMSISPLPAPTPNRNRQHVADQLAAESRSASQTPIEPASLAPWAQAEMRKGPSLKEIQEAEAKRAAEAEELLAAARRQQAEQERIAAAAAATVVSAPAPGLPATSNWASSVSPASPVPAANAWGAKATPKPTTSVSKKTLAQIQKEEEARKQRAAAQAAAQAQATNFQPANTVAGKRYAELASKVAPTSPQPTGSWTTVGASGKVKTPATVVAAPPAVRSVSSTTVPVATLAAVATTAKTRPTLQTTRTVSTSNRSKADEEFMKWARSALDNGLAAGINVDDFIRNLLQLPAEKEIIREAIYGSSQTLHGDRLSEEWLRRRKLAEKGIVEPANDTSSPVSLEKSGWSEVAKKGPTPKDENATTTNAAFKVVPTKKKGRK